MRVINTYNYLALKLGTGSGTLQGCEVCLAWREVQELERATWVMGVAAGFFRVPGYSLYPE